MNIAGATAKLATVGGPKVQLTIAKVNKFSPQILTGVGVVGGIVGTILIAKSTLKLEGWLDTLEEGKEIIRQRTESGHYDSDKARQQDLTYLYLRQGLALAKIYGPGVSVYTAALIATIAGQGLAQKRQVALVAAIKSIESSFAAYRARTVAVVGEEKESEIRYGISTETIEDSDGKKIKVKKFDPNNLSDYQAVFEEGNTNWQRGPRELNLLFLKNMQMWANDRLNARGYLYLNEVYELLGLPEKPLGQVVGWLHKDFDNGDGYVDFGWDNPVNMQKGKLIDNMDGSIVLNFNVDGEINSKL